MRYLAVDLGDRRTGLAVGDEETGIASPVDVIERPMEGGDGGAGLIGAIARAAGEYGAEALVVGLPLNMDGTEGARARLVRRFAEQIAERSGLDVVLHDERLTSAMADEDMAQTGLTRKQKKRRRDALAAAALLRGYLESKTDGD